MTAGSWLVRPLIDRGAIRRLGRARPAKIAGDKAYSRRASRRAMRQHGIVSVIPAKANEHRQRTFIGKPGESGTSSSV